MERGDVTVKVLFVCGWCLTRSDYPQYPDEWDYYSYRDVSYDEAIMTLRSKIEDYDLLIGHSLGCSLLQRMETRTKIIYINPYITQILRLGNLYKLHWLIPACVYKWFEHRTGNPNITVTKTLLDGRYPVIEQLISASYIPRKVRKDCTVIRSTNDILGTCSIEGASVKEIEDLHLPMWYTVSPLLEEDLN